MLFKASHNQRVCSDKCRSARNRNAYTRRGPLSCACCGGALVFRKGHTRNRFCSAICRRRAWRARESTQIAKRMRKAKTRGASGLERVDPLKVFARDGWCCQLCGCKTPARLRGTVRATAPELDHIVPLSCGGAHTYVNTQCACRRCNSKKGAKPLGQLRLIA